MVRLAVLIALGLALAGCVRSLQPVIKPEQQVKVAEVEGKWIDPKQEKVSLDVMPDGEGYKIVYVNEKGEPGTFQARIGRVGDMMIADIMPADLPASSGTQVALVVPVHMAIQITQAAPQLGCKIMNPDWFKEYIQAHPNELAIVKADNEPIISASTEDLQKFLIKHANDEKAWSEEQLFVRPTATKPTAPAAKP